MFVKLLKKFLSWIVTLVLMLTLSVTTLLLISKYFITVDTITEMIGATSNTLLNQAVEEINQKYNKNYDENQEVEKIDIEQIIPEELKEYIDKKEINDFLQDYIDQFIEYEIGMRDAPKIDKDKLTQIIDKGVDKYEEKTEKEFNYDELYNQIDNIDKKVTEEIKPISNKQLKTTIKMYYNNTYLYIAGVIIAICLILLFIINRSIITTLNYLGTSILINGISAVGITMFLKAVTNKLDSFSSLSDIAVRPFIIFGIIYIILGIVILLITFIIKLIK